MSQKDVHVEQPTSHFVQHVLLGKPKISKVTLSQHPNVFLILHRHFMILRFNNFVSLYAQMHFSTLVNGCYDVVGIGFVYIMYPRNVSEQFSKCAQHEGV